MCNLSFFSNFILDDDDVKPIIKSKYSSELNNESQKFSHHKCRQSIYYYEALEINVTTTGYYVLSSDSSLNTYVFLYEHKFDPDSSTDTSFANNDNSCEDYNFTITVYLKSNMTYVLVVTTSYDDMNVHGSFSVIARGSDRIYMKRIGIFNR